MAFNGTPQEREIYVRLERRKRLQDTESKKFTHKVHSTICRQKFTSHSCARFNEQGRLTHLAGFC
jgi:hypothetical protein